MSDHEYDVYDIEYTPESDGDEAEAPKNYSDSSDGESEFEATVVVEQFELLKTDDSYDEEADESSEDGSDNDFEGFDPELNGDMWKCLECKQPNTPYIRYCSACYKERKGWLPER